MTRQQRTNLIGWGTGLVIPGGIVLLWVFSAPWSIRTGSTATILASIGDVFGLAGFSLICLGYVLSTRLPLLDRFFRGLDEVYRLHHRFGETGFLFVLIHPLLVAAKYAAVSWVSAAKLFIPLQSWPITFGILALGCLELLIITTLYARLRYQLWRLIHQLSAAAIVFAALHILTQPNDVTGTPSLRAAILVLTSLAGAAYLYRVVLGTWLIRKRRGRLIAVRAAGPSAVELVLTLDRPLRFIPGQFVSISLKDPRIGAEAHPFSIVSAPGEQTLRLTIKTLGDYTERLREARPGTPLTLEGPFGAFGQLVRPGKPQVWIAGGIGITPFLSLAATLQSGHPPVTLWHSVNSEGEAVGRSALSGLAQRDPRFRYILWLSPRDGRLTAERVKSTTPLDDPDVLVCGPTRMMLDLSSQFRRLGTAPDRVHMERFGLRPD